MQVDDKGTGLLLIDRGDSPKEVQKVLDRVHYCMGWDKLTLVGTAAIAGNSVFISDKLPRNFDASQWTGGLWRGDGFKHGTKFYAEHPEPNAEKSLAHWLSTGPEHDVCGSTLPRILIKLKAARVFLRGKDETIFKCNNRLVILGSDWVPIPPESSMGPILPSANFPDKKFVVVIPDLHGDFDNGVLALCLGIQELCSKTKNCSVELKCDDFRHQVEKREEAISRGSETLSPILDSMPNKSEVLIAQMGDIVDRGPLSKRLYFLFDHLEEILGFQTVSVMGNHDFMQHLDPLGYDHYVHKSEHTTYGGREARAEEFKNGLTWDRIFSKYNLFVKVGRILFTHGGVELSWLNKFGPKIGGDVDAWNALVRARLDDTKAAKGLLHGPKEDSPIWTRTLAEPEEATCNRNLPQILTRFGVDRLILGHTPQYDGVPRTECSAHVVLSDVAVSRYMQFEEGEKATPTAYLVNLGENTVTARNQKKSIKIY